MNPARPAPGAKLADLDEIAEPGAVVRDFRAGDALFSVLIARREGRVSAFENSCPHANFPLERPDGRVVVLEARYLLCAGHGALFDMDDGACAGGPGTGRGLTPIPVEVRDGAIYVSSRSAG